MSNFALGCLYAIFAHIGTFVQLQCSLKYGWYNKYPLLVLFLGIPFGWMFTKSVQYFLDSFKGELWPGRLIGFGVGIVIFSLMSYFLFKEPLTSKSLVCISLGFLIILIQVFWK